MSDRPTPETDAAIKEQSEWKLPFVSATMDGVTYDGPVASFCRRMERERDEAREDRKKSRHSLAFALEELDEARKEAHRFRSLHYSHLGINASASWFPWEEKLGHE